MIDETALDMKYPNTHQKELLTRYASQLGYDSEKIDLLYDVVDTLDTILTRNDIHTKTMEWDRVGVHLKDGKVILPEGFEKVLFEIVKENELLKLFIPEDLGGMGFTYAVFGPIAEKVAEYDITLQMMGLLGLTLIEALLMYRKPEFEKYILSIAEGKQVTYVGFTEPNAGSNLEAIKSTSEKVGDEYVLNGTKIFISNGGYSTLGLFLCQNMVKGKKEGTNVFIVDGLDGITTLRLEHKSGIRASPTAQLLFENVTVPEENIIGKVGDGYSKVIERLLGMRASVGYQSLGASKRAYELANTYAHTRESFGKTIVNFKQISNKLDQIKTQLPRMEDYAYRAGYSLDRYIRGWIPTEVGAKGKDFAEKAAAKMLPSIVRNGLIHHYISGVKVYAAEITNYLMYDCQQIFGGNGFIEEYEVNKIARDVRVFPVYDGTSEIHNWVLERSEKAVAMIPKFQRNYNYEKPTSYEEMLFSRFPNLRSII